MRVALVANGLPPHARTGVETHAANLASALVRAGVEVEVFAPCPLDGLAPYAQRREGRGTAEGPWSVTWIHLPPPGGSNQAHEDAVHRAFGAFLDAERPDVVHFEHLLGLGLGALRAVNERNLPSLYRAHDFHLISDCPTLCAPDLSDLGPHDVDGLARARVGREFLDGFSDLGDHHGWVLEGDLDTESASRLAAILHGPSAQVEGLEAAREVIIAWQAMGRMIAAGVDRCYTSSPRLLSQLQGGLGRALECRPAGIDVQALAGDGSRTPGESLRIGFLGGIGKHKGLHLLLDAFESLPKGQVTLQVHGGGTDSVYRDQMRARARNVGADWRGAYRAQEVGEILREIDVLVVPSLWVENAPFVIMEAQAAGCPVVVSRSEFTKERVREGVDGLLFERGNKDSLLETLQRLLVEPDLMESLRAGIEPPLDLSIEVQGWVEIYAELQAERGARTPEAILPEHLVGFSGRYQELDGLTTRELFAQVSHGLESLAEGMGLDETPMEFMARAVGRGGRLRDETSEGRRALEWVEGENRAHSVALSATRERAVWREEQLVDLEGKLEWYAQRIEQGKQEVEGLRAEYQSLAEAKEEADGALGDVAKEKNWLEAQLADRDAIQAELEGGLHDARAALENFEGERDWLRKTLSAGRQELGWLSTSLSEASDRLAALEAQELEWQGKDAELRAAQEERAQVGQHVQSLEEDLASLRGHEHWLRGEVGELLTSILPQDESAAGQQPAPDDVARSLTAGTRELKRILAELSWRREEMAAAGSSAQSLRARIMGGNLAQRARQWRTPRVDGGEEQA
ncbi:MAG TPA: glycosyltransferase [Planctomycetes bacterium]|nr:glycosyltransferase [Planctomycetota bacterium]HIK59294.1 glycosyltransferase [Planctomycetota bacterium]